MGVRKQPCHLFWDSVHISRPEGISLLLSVQGSTEPTWHTARHDIFPAVNTHWSAGGGDYYDLVGTALSRKNVCGLSGNSVSQREWMCSFIKVVKKMHFSSHGIGSFHHKSNHEETLSIFVLSGSCTLVLKDPQQMIIWINTPAVGWCFDTASCLK